MKFRWWIFAIAVLIIGLVAFFPLRVALDMRGGEQGLISARQVAGTVWDGRVGEAMLGPQRLGTFNVSMRPFSVLAGATAADVERIGGLEGPLAGTVAFGGARRGIQSMSGTVGVAHLMTPLPIDRLLLSNATILFDEERCIEASGTVSAEASLGLLGLSRSLSGALSCTSDGRLQADLGGGSETLLLTIDRDGVFEAQLAVRDAPPLAASGLALAGFEIDGDVLRVTHQGILR